VTNECALDGEHAHTGVAAISDCNVLIAGHEAQLLWALQLTVAAATTTEPANKSAVTALEHRYRPGHRRRRHHYNALVGTHAARALELTAADDAVVVVLRRQH
jgi:hypothetical protein